MNVISKKTITSLIYFFFVYALVYINDVVDSKTLTKLDIQGDKSYVKPIELIDLILEEHQRPRMKVLEATHETGEELGDSRFRKETEDTMLVNNEVDASGVARKVWSKWSKWGECSATCGGGAKTRRRLCLAGRCASGEREEQRRPCCNQPCEPS